MEEETKLERHVRLAKKHLREIEKLGYSVMAGHSELRVYDFSEATNEEMSDPNFDIEEYSVAIIE